ncbi:MAG: hypothetical protein QW767_02880 [Thermoprotei archaeon]
MAQKAKGVSTPVFIVAVVVLVILAAAGFTLYAAKSSTTVTVPTTVTSTTTVTATPKHSAVLPVTSGFYNGKVVTFIYTQAPACVPAYPSFFPSASVASKVNNCEVGVGNNTAVSGAAPFWVLVPAYAGLSIFGVTALGASPQGFPRYDDQTITTQCGASGSPSQSPDHPALVFSPAFVTVEKYLNITNGYGGLPEGVLPLPAHDHIVAVIGPIPWYTVVVLVFDPNIMPNPVTGECTQVVPSNLSNATSNCLNSVQALMRAMGTTNGAIAQANSANPIWLALGKPLTQVVVPGDSSPSQVNNANSNVIEYFNVNTTNPYFNLVATNQSVPGFGD